jgi:hypothetical protein
MNRRPHASYSLSQTNIRKQKVDRTTKELASLEARLREMEDRLRRNGVATTTTSSRAPIPSFQSPDRPQEQHSTPQKQRPSKAPSSGNMPPTPGASEGEYDIITRADYAWVPLTWTIPLKMAMPNRYPLFFSFHITKPKTTPVSKSTTFIILLLYISKHANTRN